MSLAVYIRTRLLLWQARRHASAARTLWALSDWHHSRAGACLDRVEAGIAEGSRGFGRRPAPAP